MGELDSITQNSYRRVMLEARCKECLGEVILVEGWSLEAVGYGYGTFVCLKCGKESDYYSEGLVTIDLTKRGKILIGE